MLLADVGQGDLIITMFWLFILMLWFWLLITVFADLFADKEESGAKKVLWVLFVIFLPYLGVFMYLIIRGHSMGERAMKRQAEAIGVATLIVTDTAIDGMLGGINVAAMEDICMAVKTHVIASGGVSAPSDVKALRGLGCRNLVGAIVGKALYEGHTTLAEMNAAAR